MSEIDFTYNLSNVAGTVGKPRHEARFVVVLGTDAEKNAT